MGECESMVEVEVEVEAQHMENKIQIQMGGVSVSFGKYENDALAWEKWSTFYPNNKYLDEVGKCSTPGSVAQKKAFFEAHYKKIAAIKAEADLLTPTETHLSRSVDHHSEEIKVLCHHQETEISMVDQSHAAKQQQQQQEATSVDNNESFQDESCNILEPQPMDLILNNNAIKLEEAVLVNDESMKLVKHHFQMESETQQTKQDQAQPKVVNPTKAEKNLVGMKASLISKSPSSKLSKPKATPTPVPPAARSSLSSSSKSKTPYLSESRRHLSMSMNSDTASSSLTSSRRRSLFLEQMGDKDIVKRAFKTFQNRVNQLPSSSEGRSSGPKQVSKQNASTSMASQKENERSRKANPVRGLLGPTWKSVSSGSLKGVGMDQRRAPTSVVLTSNERAERRKEFFKNLEEKSNAREEERSQLNSKSKAVKEAEMKKLRQDLTFKAKPMPSFYRLSKTTTEKEGITKAAR